MNSFPFFSVLWRISFGITNLFVWRRGSFIYQFAILRQMDSRKDASQRRYSMFVSRKVQLFRHTLQIHGQRTLRYCCHQLLLSTCEFFFLREPFLARAKEWGFHFMPSSFTHLRHKTLFHLVKALTSVLRHFFRENSSLFRTIQIFTFFCARKFK